MNRAASRILEGAARGSARRDFLALGSKLLLGTVGVSTVVRYLAEVTPAVAMHECSQPRFCGMQGLSCSHCSGGAYNICPAGCSLGSFWSACCSDGWRYVFMDCCGACETTCSGDSAWCHNGPAQPNWCGGEGGNQYRCTMSIQNGVC